MKSIFAFIIFCLSISQFPSQGLQCRNEGQWTSPGFIGCMTSISVISGSNATFSCQAKKYGRLVVGWSYTNSSGSYPLVRSRAHRYNHNKFKTDYFSIPCNIFQANLTILDVSEEDQGSYACQLFYNESEFRQEANLQVHPIQPGPFWIWTDLKNYLKSYLRL